MKKLTLILLTLLALTLTACGASDSAEPASGQVATPLSEVATDLPALTISAPEPTSATSSIRLNTEYENAVSVAEQLLAGTFLLDGTDNAITAEQAAQLVPLWASLKDTTQAATQEQVDAILLQIENVMMPEQIASIANMQITRESMISSLQELGVTMGSGNGMGTNGGTPSQIGTPQAGQGPQNGQGRMNSVPPQLIEALIQFLQTKIAS